MIGKDLVKEALSELLGEIPAFQAFARSRPRGGVEEEPPPVPPRRSTSGPEDAGGSGTGTEPPPGDNSATATATGGNTATTGIRADRSGKKSERGNRLP